MMEQALSFIRANLSDWKTKNLSEAQTSQVIILRILQSLGYDIWNPFEVIPQDTSTKGGGYPDYLIYLENKEKFTVEIKGLTKDFNNSEYTQAVNYVNSRGLRWAILTNGIKWLFFDNSIKGRVESKLVLELKLTEPFFLQYLNMLLNKDFWLNDHANDELAKKVLLLRLMVSISEKSKFYAKTEIGLRYLIDRELDNKEEQQLAHNNFDFLLSFYLEHITPATKLSKSQQFEKVLPQSNNSVDLFVNNISRLKGEESGRKQVKLKVNNQEISFFSWKDIHFAIIETLVQLDKIQGLTSIIEEDKRDLEHYTETDYAKLSNDKYVYLSYSAENHKRYMRPLLESLGFSLEIFYRDNPPISLP